MKQQKKHFGRSYVEKDIVVKISERTGISKQRVYRILSVFRLAFKKYLKSSMDKPVHIESVFKAYRGRSKKNSKKTLHQKKNWRETDNLAPYKQ